MGRLSLAWMVVAVVAIVTAVVPGLRDQARLEWATRPSLRDALTGRADGDRDPLIAWFTTFRRGPMQAAARRDVKTPDLECAACAMLLPREQGLASLRAAARACDTPAAWSAYTDRLLDSGLRYERPGTAGVDPGQPQLVAAVERVLTAQHLPTALPPQQTQPLLDAVQSWRRVDPENAVPVGVEAWCLYGLHRDAEAVARWQEAAQRPRAESYHLTRVEALGRVLVQAGLPQPEAVNMSARLHLAGLERLQAMARIGLYEGRRAQLADRPEEALRTWQAGQLVGRRLQDSAQSFTAFSTGVDVEATGGLPAWVWVADANGSHGGRPGRGHLYHGPGYAFYAAQTGAAADAQLRNRLLASRMRLNVIQGLASKRSEVEWYSEAGDIIAFAQLLLVFVLGAAVLAALARLVRPGSPVTAPALRSPWHVLLGLPALVVLALAAGLTTALAVRHDETLSRAPTGGDFWASCGAALLVALLVPLVVALVARRPGFSRLGAWRTNVLTGIPIAAAVAAVVYLGCGIAAGSLRAHWVTFVRHPGMTETQMVQHFAGKQWEHPRTPSDAWKAEDPPG